jgi:septum formation protein
VTDCDLILASRSPRRHELLRQLGVRFQCLDLEIDETPTPGETPALLVQRLARGKALAGRAQAPRDVPVLGADTEVFLDGDIIGKPADPAAALATLQRLSGRTHEVYSAVALTLDSTEVLLSVTRVRFRALAAGEMERYCHGGEPFGKAGAYGIQGFAAAFIERIEGSYSGVMGLPLFETALLLGRFGVPMGRAPAP